MSKISNFFDGLPFAPFYKKLSARIPALARFDAYANQIIVGAIAVVLVVAGFGLSSGNSVKAAQKELAKINDSASRYWSDFIGVNGIDAIDNSGMTLLYVAIQSDNYDLVKACLKCGADPNKVIKVNEYKTVNTADLLICDCDNADILKIMLDNGCKLQQSDVLMRMVYSHLKNPRYVELFLKNIPKSAKDFSEKDDSWDHVFTKEVRGNSNLIPPGEIVDVLLENGVVPSKQDFSALLYCYANVIEKGVPSYEKAMKKWAKDTKLNDDSEFCAFLLNSFRSRYEERAKFIKEKLLCN